MEFGCFYCWDSKKNKEKVPLFFFDAANNLRECEYCPKCGRRYGEEPIDEQLEQSDDEYEYGDEY